MATNLDVGKYKNTLEGTCVAPSLNFMFVPSSRNKDAVAKCCAQLGRVVERLGRGERGGHYRKCFPFFAAFCDSRKTLEKMAQPSHPCLKPGLHNRQFFFCLQFLPLDSRVSPLLAPQNPSDPQTIQHVHWLESLLSMSICKKCPSQPFLSPE